MTRKMMCLAAMMAMVAGQAAAANVGVAISVGEPGFYGRLEIGNFPQPQLIYPKPVVIQPVVGVVHEPLYLRVPPGHAKDWGKHCKKYDACGRPVYFVQDNWYNNVYVPRYRETHRGQDERHDKGHDKGHGKGHG